MGFGTFYQVENEYMALFEEAVTKSDWYDVLGELNIENFPSLDVAESIPAWEYSLTGIESRLKDLFIGDLSAERNEYDDPDVTFISTESVSLFHGEFLKYGEPYFKALLNRKGCGPDIWMFKPMVRFFENTVKNKKAIVVLWGG